MKSEHKKILIVGAGFSGATIARVLAEHGFIVDIIDKRDHIAGNAFDYIHETGIRIHKYGPHIFHTSNQKVINFLSQFTEWKNYEHKAKALLSNGEYVTFPPNLETEKILGTENIFNILFKPYSEKMWGMNISELDPSVIKRVKSRNDLNEIYFPNETFQKMPKLGFTNMFKNILDHENINISLKTPYSRAMEKEYFKIFNSMPIDEYYDYKFGELEYRSIKFINEIKDCYSYFPIAHVNFTDQGPYTRAIEWKFLPNHGDNKSKTLITFEEPCDYKENNFERYYPVKDLNGKNKKLYLKYSKIKNEKNKFIGRCGLYVYIDMHQAVSSSLSIAKDFLKLQKISCAEI